MAQGTIAWLKRIVYTKSGVPIGVWWHKTEKREFYALFEMKPGGMNVSGEVDPEIIGGVTVDGSTAPPPAPEATTFVPHDTRPPAAEVQQVPEEEAPHEPPAQVATADEEAMAVLRADAASGDVAAQAALDDMAGGFLTDEFSGGLVRGDGTTEVVVQNPATV